MKKFPIILLAFILAVTLLGSASPASADPSDLPTAFLPLVVKTGYSSQFFASDPLPPPELTVLEPGAFRVLEQELDVNIVFVGYEPGTDPTQIDEAVFLEELAETYDPIIFSHYWYGVLSRLGLHFTFDYNLLFADTAFEDAFFGYLGSIAEAKDLTAYQEMYNEQLARSLDIDENYWIDAPSVEQWLADNAETMLGVDTQQYTIFFVNWYGRDDFKFHVYTKTDEPDPDTGYNFGELRDSRKMIAWGGTTPDDEETGLGALHRIWFYDLSAGPERWTDNWNLDDADLDGNEVLDYRMPPVWEYGNLTAYRPFDNLSGDLGKVTRYVGVDLLFTTSPLYKPAISPPELPDDIQLDINVYQGDPHYDALDDFIPDLINQELGELQPLNTFTTELTEQAFNGRARQVYECFWYDVSCFGSRLFGIAIADLFLYHQDHLMQFLEGDADYELPIFAYNTSEEFENFLLGFADDNWRDGTQSFVFAFDDPITRDDYGYGFTTTIIHEVGHHLGMSHPHDGYDSEADADLFVSDRFYFVNSGDESNSMMSYIDLNWDFSQFDRDNMNRYMTTIYINQANAILDWIVKSPKANRVSVDLEEADLHAGMALEAFEAMDYPEAAFHAKLAYETIVAAAYKINIKVEPQSWQADYKAKGKSSHFVDPVHYLHRFDP